MKVKTTKQDLLGALNASFKAIPAKASFPLMECFKLDASEDTMDVTATDGAMTIIATLDAQGEGSAVVNAKMLLDSVRLLPDGDIDIETDDIQCTVNYNRGRFSIPTYPVEDFPTIEESKFAECSSVAQDALKGALAYVLPSVAKDQLRPQLSGVYFNPTEDGYDIVATDSHSLAVEHIPCAVNTGDFIIPSNAAAFIKDNIKGEDAVIIQDADTKAIFTFGRIELRVVKTVGKFPNYKQVIPTKNESFLTTKVADLLGAVRRVGTCSDKAKNTIKFTLSTLGGATIESQDIGFGCAAREEMEVGYNGEDLTIGFKGELLQTILGCVEEDEVTMTFGTAKTAVLVKSENEGRTALLMPVAIQ